MKTNQFLPTLFSMILILFLSSCVMQKKYDDLLFQKTASDEAKAALQEELALTTNKKKQLEGQLAELKKDTANIGEALRKCRSNVSDLDTKYQTLDKHYKLALNSQGVMSKDLAKREKDLLALETNLEMERKKAAELEADLAIREQRVIELEKIIADQEYAVKKLKETVSKALLNFQENELKVEIRNGKVYVSLAEQLLFNSGSIQVDPKGVSALKQLSGVLKNEKDIHVTVEGHTDNVPIGRTSQYMNDNWDLSVLRATSIIRILVGEGVNPQQVTASGRGEFSPLAPNTTKEDRQKNRRTEIILTPNLDELFDILNK